MASIDTRAPCPPYGYSCTCTLAEAKQIELVAEFHAHRIRPTRIAYRLGIDIALIDALLAGERDVEHFTALVQHFRQRRLRQRLRDAERIKGQAAYEQRRLAQQEYESNSAI